MTSASVRAKRLTLCNSCINHCSTLQPLLAIPHYYHFMLNNPHIIERAKQVRLSLYHLINISIIVNQLFTHLPARSTKFILLTISLGKSTFNLACKWYTI